MFAQLYSKGRRRNDQIKLAIGIDCGVTWVINGVDIFGGVTDTAFKLGEDIASKEILVTAAVADELELSNGKRWSIKRRMEDVNGIVMEIAKVSERSGAPFFAADTPFVVSPTINAEEPQTFVDLMYARRGERVASTASSCICDMPRRWNSGYDKTVYISRIMPLYKHRIAGEGTQCCGSEDMRPFLCRSNGIGR